MYQFRVVATKNGFDAHGYVNGILQGTYWSSTSEEGLRRVLKSKYPNIEVL